MRKCLSNEYNIVFVSDVFFDELPAKCPVKATRSCVDFVLPKLFSHINNVFELQHAGIDQSTTYK